MPYLSKIALNPRRRTAVSLLSSPHRLHAAVLAGLAVQPVVERVLWRLENNTPHRAEVLVLTESRPSWAHLVDDAGWPGADGGAPLIADYTPLLERIVRGREFGFRLTANPVQSVPRPTRPSEEQATRLKEKADHGNRHRGFRVAHRTVEQQLTWLLKRSERHGFTIPDATAAPPGPGLQAGDGEPEAPAPSAGPAVAIVSRDILRFTKHKAGPRITLSTATFEGRLRVTDPDALRSALLGGIGPAKGYGQGLLTLAPLSPTEKADHG
ncbi:type I-E CRISPR-associated protein Cas6/Cse3/CasE (plasmid) [Streptomyces sp. WAC00288]|uniref:type I-E CRISPR-associated protein Cas6/Cse3/CasE n=1 Tax=unclassified Streptomyces TaxID=2593676 RepID=UPI0007899A0D|nr:MULTISPECIES: type I-E CRISPR-associated protein Cas6/Cse3/CasE [unclassified Streptomyces]AVI00168.1 type I-E CRISPR-associated protein Cas6/Cse3/CasE [Streptomyces sp. WAC00288]KYG51237.1 type I-E CRISPR-associated protein Cas6/Cse3/CasE [Streptomyces sp. WAC04657]